MAFPQSEMGSHWKILIRGVTYSLSFNKIIWAAMRNETGNDQDLMQEHPLGGCSVIQGRKDSGSMDQGGHSDDGEKWLDSGYILKVGLM